MGFVNVILLFFASYLVYINKGLGQVCDRNLGTPIKGDWYLERHLLKPSVTTNHIRLIHWEFRNEQSLSVAPGQDCSSHTRWYHALGIFFFPTFPAILQPKWALCVCLIVVHVPAAASSLTPCSYSWPQASKLVTSTWIFHARLHFLFTELWRDFLEGNTSHTLYKGRAPHRFGCCLISVVARYFPMSVSPSWLPQQQLSHSISCSTRRRWRWVQGQLLDVSSG